MFWEWISDVLQVLATLILFAEFGFGAFIGLLAFQLVHKILDELMPDKQAKQAFFNHTSMLIAYAVILIVWTGVKLLLTGTPITSVSFLGFATISVDFNDMVAQYAQQESYIPISVLIKALPQFLISASALYASIMMFVFQVPILIGKRLTYQPEHRSRVLETLVNTVIGVCISILIGLYSDAPKGIVQALFTEAGKYTSKYDLRNFIPLILVFIPVCMLVYIMIREMLRNSVLLATVAFSYIAYATQASLTETHRAGYLLVMIASGYLATYIYGKVADSIDDPFELAVENFLHLAAFGGLALLAFLLIAYGYIALVSKPA